MSSKSQERHRKAVRLAGARISLNESGAPTLLCGLPDSFPSRGIERSRADAFVPVGERRVRGDNEMRSELGIRPAVELVRAAETNGPAWMWSGVGNVGLNKYCLAWQRGKLYYSAHDEPVLASGWEFDACVWVHTNGWQVRFERVSFVRRGSVWEPLIAGETVSGVQLILTGQRLVERGTPIDPTRDANSRHAVSYVDKRHIVLNAYTRVKDRRTQATAVDGKGEPIKRDFGLDQILDKHELLKAAIEGAVVPLRLELQDTDDVCYDITSEDLSPALVEKSYGKCEDLDELTERQRSGERGLFYIDTVGNTCHLVYRRSPYPLHFLAIRKNGDAVLIDAVVGGFSKNAGCTVGGLASDLRSCGYTEALLDNGGDAVLVRRGQSDAEGWADPNGLSAIVPSSLGRTQWAALMLYQFQTDAGIDVRCEAAGQDGRVCIKWE
jgi:hypothetical protein